MSEDKEKDEKDQKDEKAPAKLETQELKAVAGGSLASGGAGDLWVCDECGAKFDNFFAGADHMKVYYYHFVHRVSGGS